MHKVNLYKADLSHAVLSVVNFTEADLRRVNLNDAKIYEVDFTGSDFQDASLGFYAQGRVIMRNTNLCGADLREVKYISGVYVWEGAIYNTATLWPKDFNPVEAGAVLSTEEDTAK
jgi:uncharacterized protein YjbI with pentapeptide repeats